MEWIIYKHTSPSGKVYIGQTCKNPIYRWSHGNGYIHAPKFWRAIKKYGWNNIQHDIIETGITSQKTANEREIYWINYYNSFNQGYNATAGGHTQKHLSIPILMIDKDTLLPIKEFPSASEAARVLHCTQGRISAVCRGDGIEAQGYYWCLKSDWHKDWKPRTRESKNSRAVYQIDATTFTIKQEYNSINEASLYNHLTRNAIENCCRNQYSPINNNYWCYKENWHPDWKPRIKTASKHGMREVICIETSEIYHSIADAARANHTSSGNILSCCQHNIRTINGFHFCYAEDYDDAKNFISNYYLEKAVRCIEIGTVFKSISEASKISGINKSQISQCCCGTQTTAGDLHWCYEKDFSDALVVMAGKKKKVRCIETGIVYNSQADAFKQTNIRHITECCKRTIPTAGGYHWCYESDWNDTWTPLPKKDKKQVLCVETGVVYASIRIAANSTNANYSEIGKCCKNKNYTSGGYHWEYVIKE